MRNMNTKMYLYMYESWMDLLEEFSVTELLSFLICHDAADNCSRISQVSVIIHVCNLL